MRALLQKSCKTCTESSIETYYYTIRGLAKLVGLEEIPLDHKWINDTLFERVKLQAKTTSSKNLAVAALKALRAYTQTDAVKKKIEKWGSFVSKVSEKYSQVRNKQERTKRESKNWPKGGYDDIRKLAGRLRKEDVVQRALQKAPARITFTELWYLGRWLTFTFYSRHALRGDLADMQIKKKGANYLYKSRGGKWHVHVGDHKTAKSHGAIDIQLHQDVHKALNLVLPYVRAKTSHGYLLSTKRYGNRMRRVDMMKMLRNTTEQYLGKRIGIQMLRVMKTTSHLKELDDAASLRQEMGHSASMQFKYVSRAK
jgi:hypothetical protein